nr:uncharacterized protein LOC127303785 [Lolium perenne]
MWALAGGLARERWSGMGGSARDGAWGQGERVGACGGWRLARVRTWARGEAELGGELVAVGRKGAWRRQGAARAEGQGRRWQCGRYGGGPGGSSFVRGCDASGNGGGERTTEVQQLGGTWGRR